MYLVYFVDSISCVVRWSAFESSTFELIPPKASLSIAWEVPSVIRSWRARFRSVSGVLKGSLSLSLSLSKYHSQKLCAEAPPWSSTQSKRILWNLVGSNQNPNRTALSIGCLVDPTQLIRLSMVPDRFWHSHRATWPVWNPNFGIQNLDAHLDGPRRA